MTFPANPQLRNPGWFQRASLLLSLALISTSVFCQPRLVLKKSGNYQVGERISREITVLDRNLQEVPLLDLVRADSLVVVLVLFGGGMRSRPDREEFRGTLWCEDSFDDLSVQRALYHWFKERPVQFIPVAVPPVYKPETFGWEDDDFLGHPPESTVFTEAARSFVDATEREALSGLIPYPILYYDPKFRLLQNKEERELGPEYGSVRNWQGKFRWSEDGRKYGVPILWFLDNQGKVLTPPLYGNEYEGDPPQVHYGFREARDLIEELLQQTGR